MFCVLKAPTAMPDTARVAIMHLRREITTNGKLKQKDHSFKEILYDYLQNILYMVALL